MIIMFSQQSDSVPFGNPQARLLFHAGPVPVSPTSAAASKLADALDKLRQVSVHLLNYMQVVITYMH